MPKIQIYSANAIIMANVFKYLPKSEAIIHTCSLKKLSRSVSHNRPENTCAGVYFSYIWTIFFQFHFKPTTLLFWDSFYSEQINNSYFTSHCVVLEHLKSSKARLFDGSFFLEFESIWPSFPYAFNTWLSCKIKEYH